MASEQSVDVYEDIKAFSPFAHDVREPLAIRCRLLALVLLTPSIAQDIGESDG